MIVRAIKTDKIIAGMDLLAVLDKSLEDLPENSVLAVTSKIVSMCQGRVVPSDTVDRDKLVTQEADMYLPRRFSNYNFELTITKKTLIMSAGIDESNAAGNYVLWPDDPQKSANQIRKYLKDKFSLKNFGVVITDSSCTPLRWGTTGIAIAYSGFNPNNSYIGQPDLFGRKLKVSKSNVAGGLAGAGVVCMGEGSEQTPMALITDVPFVKFRDGDPTKEELETYFINNVEQDVFAPLLNSVKWEKGSRGKEK
jgi:dihydrofolate synthase / folylpolyglutamate synthase